MEELIPIEFSAVTTQTLPVLESKETKECFTQWNLDKSLIISRFQYSHSGLLKGNDEKILKDFIRFIVASGTTDMTGTPSIPLDIKYELLNTQTMGMDFFDRLQEHGIIEKSGTIRGCFEENYEGIIISDKLREMFGNIESENNCLYSTSEKKELIYNIFKILVLGGPLNQSDTKIDRYLSLTKQLYKELLTVYKDAQSGKVVAANKIYLIMNIEGVALYPHHEHIMNCCIVNIDPVKKFVTLIKHSYLPFW